MTTVLSMETCNKRIRYNYIDRLKGLAITLVVIGHLILWCYEDNNNGVFIFVNSVHMPLFMFLSGVVINIPPTSRRWIVLLFRFLCPFLIIGGLLSLFDGRGLLKLFTSHHKCGYWYLYILSLFYSFLYLRGLLKVKETKKNLVLDIVFFLVLYAAFWVLDKNMTSSTNDLIGIGLCRLYWPYFYLGYLVNRYNLMRFVINYGYTVGLLILLPCSYFFVNGVVHLSNIVALSFIYVLLYLFRERENCFTFIDNYLQTIGKSSIDVYIYHYFFHRFISFPVVGVYLLETNNILFFVLLLFVVSILIIQLCLIVGIIIKKSFVLDNIVYGRIVNRWI